MRQPVGSILTIVRVTQGVRLVKLDEGSNISSITRVLSEDAATKQKEEENNNQISIEATEPPQGE